MSHLVLPQFLTQDILHGNDVARKALNPAAASLLAQQSVMGREVTPEQVVANMEPTQLKAILSALNVGEDVADQLIADQMKMQQKTTTDPVVLLQPYTQTGLDFAAQYPTPLDPTEILTLCEEIGVFQALPEVVTPLNVDQWREMNALAFDATGAAADGFFLKGGCPDSTTHSGTNRSVTRMYIGAQQTLSYEDIKHSAAVAAMNGLGISAISTQERRAAVADIKAKEMLLQEILVLNNWDLALVKGNATTNVLAFDGIETQVTSANGARVNSNPTGQFDIETFDNFLNAGCARATHIFGHPKALEAIKKGYLSLGATGGTQPIQQILVTQEGNKVVPGFTLADQVDTSIGRITLIPDFRFTAVQAQPDRFHSTVYPLRVYHNGEPIVYKSTQTPLSFKDLAPGCTAISFMIYAVTALAVRHMCAQSAFQANFPGVIGTGCDIVAGTTIG